MTEPANNLAVLPVQQAGFNTQDIFATPAQFEHAQRVAKVFSVSELVPAHLRKNPADTLLAYAIARRMGEDPVIVTQNIFFVSGRAGWKTEYMIGRANKSGVFKGRINWRSQGQGDTLAVTAFAKLADTGEEITATATMGMAKAEGWTRNPKYGTMPEHMLRWRSATMLIRLFAPEVMLGVSTREELEDIQTLAPGADGTYAVASTPQSIDAALEAAAEESGRDSATPPPADAIPVGEREGTDSAATPDEPLAPKACRTLIGTLDADALTRWLATNEAKIQALAPTARQIIRAAISDRKTALGV